MFIFICQLVLIALTFFNTEGTIIYWHAENLYINLWISIYNILNICELVNINNLYQIGWYVNLRLSNGILKNIDQ